MLAPLFSEEYETSVLRFPVICRGGVACNDLNVYIHIWFVNGRYVPRKRLKYERDTRCESRRKVSKLSRDSSRNTRGASTETEEKNQPTRGWCYFWNICVYCRLKERCPSVYAIFSWRFPPRGNHRYAVTRRDARITGFRRRKFVEARRANPRSLWGMRLLFRRSLGVEVATWNPLKLTLSAKPLALAWNTNAETWSRQEHWPADRSRTCMSLCKGK